MTKLTFYLIFWCFVCVGVYGGIPKLDNNLNDILKTIGLRRSDIAVNSNISNLISVYVPLSSDYDNALCRNHSLLYGRNLLNQTSWAMRMLSSSSKLPDGIYMGNLVQFGNYDECLDIENIASDDSEFSGQHCVVQIYPPGTNIAPAEGMSLFSPSDFDRLQKGDTSHFALGLKWSVCVPSSCRAEDVEAHLGVAMSPLSVRVDAITCNTRAKKVALTPLDWFAIGLLSFFAILVILSTSYDLISTDSAKRRELLVAYSLYTNGNKLLNASAGKDSLPAVHGVRFLSMMWVILGHRYMEAGFIAAINILDRVPDLMDWKHIFVMNATLSVDSFLLLSGLLLCYLFLKEMDAGTPFNVPIFYLHRYIRLTPAFAVLILLTVTLFPYMGDGPFWNVETQYVRNKCLTSWWSALLYINNYVNTSDQCWVHTWYLSLDMQLFWLSPLILYPLWRHPKIGVVMLGALFGIGLLIAFFVPYINKYIPDMLPETEAYIYDYIPTHTRFTPWLIGIGLGYLLHRTKNSTIRLSRMSVILGWLLAVALMLTSVLLGHRFKQIGHHYERLFESFYICLLRPAWALGLAWVIFACLKGYGGFVNTFLSWRLFRVLSRFTYTIYLIHLPIQKLIAASTKTPTYLNDRMRYSQYFGDVVLSFVAAVVLTLVFESPAILIEKSFFKTLAKWQSSKRKLITENKFRRS